MVLLVVFSVLLNLAILIANVEQSKSQSHVSANALYLVRLDWSGNSDSDLDLYCQDGVGHLSYFRRLNDGAMTLTRDCTGNHSNRVTLPDGRVVQSAINQETIEIRSIIEGEYCCNVHFYRQAE